MSFTTDQQLEDLYERTAWYFEEKHKSSKAFAYDFFKQAVKWVIVIKYVYFITIIYAIVIHFSDPKILAECELDDETKQVLLNNIQRKLTMQAVKIRADVEVACYEYEGIDAVKAALKAGLELSTEELPIKINLIAPPLYGI